MVLHGTLGLFLLKIVPNFRLITQWKLTTQLHRLESFKVNRHNHCGIDHAVFKYLICTDL
jgi:hypothetical protein